MHTYIQTLTKLNLADNNLGPEGTQFLAELLDQNEVYLIRFKEFISFSL